MEEERSAEGRLEPALTLFLAGAECPFTCVFCDLWRHTGEEPTAEGSLPAQVEWALREVQKKGQIPPDLFPRRSRLKLYNASNFFDPRAVPLADEEALIDLVRPFHRVVVECHPAFVGERCLRFAARLDGRLEVAMGLECAHPEVLPRLNKKMTLADFDAAAARLREVGIALRAFVLVAPPFLPAPEAVEWAVRSAEHAFDQGAQTVVLIPTRGGNGEMERLLAGGLFTPPTLDQVEEALDRALPVATAIGGTVTVDTWDLDTFARCSACVHPRRQRLERINLSGQAEPRVTCSECDGR